MRLNQILTIVFLVLLIPSVIKCVSSGIDITTAEERPKLFDGYNKDNVASIVIAKKVLGDDGKPKIMQDGQPELESIRFVKNEGKWKIASGSYPGALEARASDIDMQILEPLGKIEDSSTSRIVPPGADDETLKRYELDEDHAITVTATNKSGQLIADLLVGRSAGGADLGANATSGTYVRRPKDKLVILTDENIALVPKLDSWVNKTLLDVSDEKDIRKLTLRNEKGEVSFEREADDKPWKASKKPDGMGEIRDSELTSLVSRAKYVAATNFVELEPGKPQAAHGINEAKIQVILETKDKKSFNLRIGNVVEGKEERYAHLSNYADVLFTLASYDVDAFKKDPREYFDPEKEDPKKDPKKDAPKKDSKSDGDQAPAKKDAKPKNGGDKAPEKKSDPKKNG